MKGRELRVEDLLVPKILAYLGELDQPRLATSEGESTIALHPVVRSMFHPLAGPQLMFGIMARTAILFVVDHDEFETAVASAGAAPVMPELPPLPYPRVAVECAEDATWALGSAPDHHAADLEAIAISETSQGERWEVCLLLRPPISSEEQLDALRSAAQGAARDRKAAEEIMRAYGQHVALFTLDRGGAVTMFSGGQNGETWLPRMDELQTEDDLQRAFDKVRGKLPSLDEMTVRYEPDDPRAISLRALPIEFAQLANARGVTVEHVSVPRAQRRRFERKRLVHPRVYFVKIGEASDDHAGHGDREYHCRWLVRGHWVRPNGKPKHWRRAHIRGPAGAPWKGRPVYVTAAVTDAA